MAAPYKTPGVYVEEVGSFSSPVVAVPTAIPALIGFTECAQEGHQDLTNVPTPISSIAERPDECVGGCYGGASGRIHRPDFSATDADFLIHSNQRNTACHKSMKSAPTPSQ